MIDIKEVPYNYSVCYASEADCPLRNHCLRSLAAQAFEALPEPPETQRCVTPTYVRRAKASGKCANFRSDKKLRYARGMRRLFDLVPKGRYTDIRWSVIRAFSSERVFYYAQAGDTFIPPETQAEILDIFAQAGLPEPQFDTYVERYDWSL